MNLTNVNLIIVFAALLPWACIAAGALLTPRMTRPDLFFSVTVSPSFRVSETGSAILRQYRLIVIIAALIALLPICLINVSPRLLLVGILAPVMIEIVGCSSAFLIARSRTLPHHVAQTTEREAELVPRKTSLAGGLPGQAGPFLVLAIFGIILAINWQRIPERFPIHWGVDGKPNGWADKGVASVFGMLIMGVMVCALVAWIQYAITHNVRRIKSSGSAGTNEALFIRRMSWFLLGLEFWLASLMGGLSLLALRRDQHASLGLLWLILPFEALIIAGVFVVCYRMGQGGSRLPNGVGQTPTDAPPVGDRTPDECWKWGAIYYNRNDPALIVEKRFGVGWTFNFARSGAWWILGAILSFGVGSVILGVLMSHPR